MNERLLKKIILEEIRKVLNEQETPSNQKVNPSDQALADEHGGRVRDEGEDAAGENSNNAFKAVGLLLSFAISGKATEQSILPDIKLLNQFRVNTGGVKLTGRALKAFDIVSREDQNSKKYHFDIALAYSKGGIQKAVEVVKKMGGEVAPQYSQSTQQASPTTKQAPAAPQQQTAQSKEVESPNFGSRNNPASGVQYLKSLARQSPDIYKGKIGFFRTTPEKPLQSIQL